MPAFLPTYERPLSLSPLRVVLRDFVLTSLQYVGEEGAACEPWNLELSNKALQRTFVGQNLYSRVLGSKSIISPCLVYGRIQG